MKELIVVNCYIKFQYLKISIEISHNKFNKFYIKVLYHTIIMLINKICTVMVVI